MDDISKTASVKKAAPRNRNKKPNPIIVPENWHQMIAEAAYYHAEARGFEGGHEIDDWLEAEAAIDQTVRKTN